MPIYTPRALRRNFIINALEHGADSRVVAKWQGHRDAKLILGTYGNFVSKEHEKAQIAKLTDKKQLGRAFEPVSNARTCRWSHAGTRSRHAAGYLGGSRRRSPRAGDALAHSWPCLEPGTPLEALTVVWLWEKSRPGSKRAVSPQ